MMLIERLKKLLSEKTFFSVEIIALFAQFKWGNLGG